jgi:IS1 family transposase
LWNKVESQAVGDVYTDRWKSYNEMVPKEKLTQGKKGANTVESFNGQIRHFLGYNRQKSG